MKITRLEKNAPDGLIKFSSIDIGKIRLSFAKSESVWYDEAKKKLIPIWLDKKGLFIYKVAVKIGFIPQVKKNIKKV